MFWAPDHQGDQSKTGKQTIPLRRESVCRRGTHRNVPDSSSGSSVTQSGRRHVCLAGTASLRAVQEDRRSADPDGGGRRALKTRWPLAVDPRLWRPDRAAAAPPRGSQPRTWIKLLFTPKKKNPFFKDLQEIGVRQRAPCSTGDKIQQMLHSTGTFSFTKEKFHSLACFWNGKHFSF